MTSDEIRHDTSVNQAVLSPPTNENNLKITKTNTIPTMCVNKLLKVEDKLKASTFKGPSHTSLTNKSTPFKCPLQRSSTENVPSGKFCLTSCYYTGVLFFISWWRTKKHCILHFFPAISDEKENICHYFNVVW